MYVDVVVALDVMFEIIYCCLGDLVHLVLCCINAALLWLSANGWAGGKIED